MASWKNFASRAARSCSTTTTRSNTSPTATSARSLCRATRKRMYWVGPKYVFPETFLPVGNPAVREALHGHHADLLDAAFWQSHKQRIEVGQMLDVFPYDEAQRFHPPWPRPVFLTFTEGAFLHERIDRHRRARRPHPDGRLPGRLLFPRRARPGRRGHPAAVERAGITADSVGEVRRTADGRPVPRARRPTRAACPTARRGHAQQDVRLGHEGRRCSRTTCCSRARTRSWWPAAWRA